VCPVCKTSIAKGQYRIDFRFVQSKVLGDQKRVHPECTPKLPQESRPRDIKFLRKAILDENNSIADRAMLHRVLTAMDHQ
jgi:hypothetical protein